LVYFRPFQFPLQFPLCYGVNEQVQFNTLLIGNGSALGMDSYPIRPSGSGRISSIRQNPTPAGLLVSHRVGQVLITVSTSVRKSVNAACQLSDCRAMTYA